MRIALTAGATLLCLAALSTGAMATPRTWVSGSGSDSGNCAFATPCRTFTYAISQTDAGGEIDVKDSAPYGAFTINKSITIVGDPSQAHVGVQANSTAINIAAGANDAIVLRGLSIDGDGATETFGVQMTSGRSLVIDHCVFASLTQGVRLVDANVYAMITNSLFTTSYIGLVNGGAAYAVLGNDVITANSYGIYGTWSTYGDNDLNGNISADIPNGQASLTANAKH